MSGHADVWLMREAVVLAKLGTMAQAQDLSLKDLTELWEAMDELTRTEARDLQKLRAGLP